MKNDYIRIRLSKRDKELIRKAAKLKQMTMSEYIIHLVRLDCEKENIKGVML